MPTSLDDDVSLSAILLGAAYGDVLKIPQIQAAFSDRAKSIGGKHGRSVYDLKEPISEIQSGSMREMPPSLRSTSTIRKRLLETMSIPA